MGSGFELIRFELSCIDLWGPALFNIQMQDFLIKHVICTPGHDIFREGFQIKPWVPGKSWYTGVLYMPLLCFWAKAIAKFLSPQGYLFSGIYSGVPYMLSMNSRSWKKKHHLSHAPYINHKSRDNMRQDCCGILPTFLSFGTHQGKTTPYVTANQKPLWVFSSLLPQRNVSFPQQITITAIHHLSYH